MCVAQQAFVDLADMFLQKGKGRAGRTVRPCACSDLWIKEGLLCLIDGAGGNLSRKAHHHFCSREMKWFDSHNKMHN